MIKEISKKVPDVKEFGKTMFGNIRNEDDEARRGINEFQLAEDGVGELLGVYEKGGVSLQKFKKQLSVILKDFVGKEDAIDEIVDIVNSNIGDNFNPKYADDITDEDKEFYNSEIWYVLSKLFQKQTQRYMRGYSSKSKRMFNSSSELGKTKMYSGNKITVSKEFVEDAISAVWTELYDQYGNELHEVFFNHLMDWLLELDEIKDSAYEIVDNFLINADLGYLDDYIQDENLSDEEKLAQLDPIFVETYDGKPVVLLNWGF